MVDAALPGRPGNLTADQEIKLKELWAETLKVFGVASPDVDSELAHLKEEDHEQQVKTPDKKKKKRRLFSRKYKDDDGDSQTDGQSTASDDKYGQTKEFHEALADSSPEDLRKAFWSMVKHDHPDGLLLRFLRARKWDVEKALVMLISTMHWRMYETHVDDDIFKAGEGGAAEQSTSSNAATKKEGDDFLAQLRLGKSFLHGTDKEGRPMCFVRVRLHKQGEQSEASLERYTVFVIESARLLLSPPVDTATIVFDMTGFSMANMDYAPVKFMIKCFEANYPESLGAVLVHKSPWVFQGIWNIIKGWLDPVVAGKVHFTKNTEELEAYVPREHIIKELGGDDSWTYQYVEPVAGENDLMLQNERKQQLLDERALVVRDFESATQQWFAGQNTEDTGTQQRRNDIAEKLRSGYWQLDPYLRARSFYDRTGMIQLGGNIQFYSSHTNNAAVNGPTPATHDPSSLD
ncbi:hypothetical protein MMC20_004184 [Loxospora ochrophaea]|nr:hypothetical protein [Loxospora ochrophaea]